MSLIESDNRTNGLDLQGLQVSVSQDETDTRIELRIDNRVQQSIVECISAFVIYGQRAIATANDNAERQRNQMRFQVEAEKRKQVINRRVRLIMATERIVRVQGLSPDDAHPLWNRVAAQLNLSRTDVVRILQLRWRLRGRRHQDMRRAHAYRWSLEGVSTKVIGSRLGIGVRAVNKLIKSELDRRNRVVGKIA